MKSVLRWLDANTEKVVLLITYSGMAGIIFVEVVRRFIFSQQAAWSTTVPILLFLWVTWFGASWNIKKRSHLSLNELRLRLPPVWQMCCLVLDAVLWIVFAVIVVYFTTHQVYLAWDNFAIVEGTDDVMQWWFYMATPLAWALIIIRVLQNLFEDIGKFRRGEPLVVQTSLLD